VGPVGDPLVHGYADAFGAEPVDIRLRWIYGPAAKVPISSPMPTGGVKIVSDRRTISETRSSPRAVRMRKSVVMRSTTPVPDNQRDRADCMRSGNRMLNHESNESIHMDADAPSLVHSSKLSLFAAEVNVSRLSAFSHRPHLAGLGECNGDATR
jgi:hypothetical protein